MYKAKFIERNKDKEREDGEVWKIASTIWGGKYNGIYLYFKDQKTAIDFAKNGNLDKEHEDEYDRVHKNEKHVTMPVVDCSHCGAPGQVSICKYCGTILPQEK